MGIVIGIIAVLAVAGFLVYLTCKSKNSDLCKWIGIAIFVALCLTWVIPYGYFQEGKFFEYAMKRIGLNDIPTILYYGVYFCLTTLIYLLTLGGFYGVISKTKSYQTLVKRFAKSVKGKEVLTSIIMMVVLVALTSVVKTPFVLLVFVPFLISVLLNAKFDRLTTMGLTFGSILVGTLAATFGTDGLFWWNNYLSVKDVTVGLNYRVIIGGVSLVLFIIYNVYRVMKFKKNRPSDLDSDLYAIEETKADAKIWPTVVIFSGLLLIVLLGYVGWESNFGIDWFTKFHKWLTDLSIGEFQIFSYILGSNATPFGAFELSSMITILLVNTLIVKLMNGIKGTEFVSAFNDGFKKMVKPVCLFVLTYVLFIISYMSPFMAYISNWAFELTDKFNPFITSITAFVTSVFHADLGYSAYVVGSVLTSNYAASFDLIHTIYVAMYGLVQLCIPTSGLLLIGLSYLKIDYKSWFSYIWKFFVAMFVVILILATIVTYI